MRGRYVSAFCHWCSGRIGLNYLKCAYLLHYSLSFWSRGFGRSLQVSERYYGVWTKGVPVELARKQPERAKIKLLQALKGRREGGRLSGGSPASWRSRRCWAA